MDLMLFNPVKYERLYNCSFYSIDTIPLSERQHSLVGMIFIIAYVILFVPYCCCLYAMLVTDLKQWVSYKLMIQLGFIHLIGVHTSGLYIGVMAIEGAVFCSHPTLNYIVGCFAVSSWCASTLANMILGVNRCCELYSPILAEKMFGFWRIYIWLAMPLAYMTYLFLYTPPPVFSGILMALFFNPHLGYFDDFGLTYYSVAHSTNNLIVCCIESCVYFLMIFLYRRAINSASPEIRNKMKKEKRIYIQVVLIGFIHFTASSSYVLMQFIPVNFYTVLVASSFYFLSQGFPSVIYLSVNRTLRNALLRRMLAQKGAVSTSVSNQGRVKEVFTVNAVTEKFTEGF